MRKNYTGRTISAVTIGALLSACSGHVVTPQLNTDSSAHSSPIARSNMVLRSLGSVSAGTPEATLSPTSLVFRTNVGSQSPPQNVVLSNPGTGTLAISKIVISTVTSTCLYCGFIESNNCGTQLASGAKCTITISFLARRAGGLQSKLLVSDNVSGSPQAASLVGYAQCAGYGQQCYFSHPCCPGLVCVPASTRAFCEPAGTRQSYLRGSVLRDVGWLHLERLLGTGTISVIDIAKQAVTRTVAVGSDPGSVAITPDGKKLYVAEASTDSLTVIDTNTNTVVKTIVVGFGIRPVDVAVSVNGRSAYVMSSHNGVASVIDTATDTVTGTVHAAPLWTSGAILRRCAPGVVGSRDGRIAYVVNTSSNAESVPIAPGDELVAVLGSEALFL